MHIFWADITPLNLFKFLPFPVNDSQQRIRDNDGENKEQELTDAENMSKEMELDETSEALSEKPDLSDQRSESGKHVLDSLTGRHSLTAYQELV